MSSVNKVILVGRLGRDPELRYTQNGQAVANFSLATEESFKNGAGERQKRTEWHRLVAWGKQAEIVQQYLKRGSLVYIEGRIQSREYEKDGQKRTSYDIVMGELKMLGSASGGTSQNNAPTPQQNVRPTTQGARQAQGSSSARGGYQRGAQPAQVEPADEDISF